MNILDKHPAPWQQSEPLPEDAGRPQLIVDANGDPVIGVVHCEQPLWISDNARRLILAAPELLAALKEMCRLFDRNEVQPHDSADADECYEPFVRATALIERIEKP